MSVIIKKFLTIIIIFTFIISTTENAFAFNPDDFENKYGGKDVTGDVIVNVDAPVYMLDDCKLIVNGKEISDYNDYVKIYYDGSYNNYNVQAQIPFITVIKEMGAKVIPLGDNNAIIFFNGDLFFLDIKNHLLMTTNPLGILLVNVFSPKWIVGAPYVSEYTPLKNECIVDTTYSFEFFTLICKLSKINTTVDPATATITIESK